MNACGARAKSVPYATLRRFAVAELGLGRTSVTIPAAVGDDDSDDRAFNQTLPLALPPGRAAIPRADWEHPSKQPQRCAQIDGFSLHAHTAIEALDRAGLERLCRYGLRSPFALSRLSLCDDGRLRYRLKRPWPDGRTELLLTPLELLRRSAHLIPLPTVAKAESRRSPATRPSRRAWLSLAGPRATHIHASRSQTQS